jgi:hypothetical protein
LGVRIMPSFDKLKKLAGLIRYYSLISTTAAGSGHPSLSLSATDLKAGLFFGGIYRFDLDQPAHPMGEAVKSALSGEGRIIHSLAVRKNREAASLRNFRPMRKYPRKPSSGRPGGWLRTRYCKNHSSL